MKCYSIKSSTAIDFKTINSFLRFSIKFLVKLQKTGFFCENLKVNLENWAHDFKVVATFILSVSKLYIKDGWHEDRSEGL